MLWQSLPQPHLIFNQNNSTNSHSPSQSHGSPTEPHPLSQASNIPASGLLILLSCPSYPCLPKHFYLFIPLLPHISPLSSYLQNLTHLLSFHMLSSIQYLIFHPTVLICDESPFWLHRPLSSLLAIALVLHLTPFFSPFLLFISTSDVTLCLG